MSISDYLRKKEYIVSVNDFQDLESIYDDLETQGKTPPTVELIRSVDCVHRRSTSRNTHYLLADWEADALRNDPRIKSVTLAPRYLGIKSGTNDTVQTSTAWDKSGTTSNNMKNWGLLRCVEGTQRVGWGGTGYSGGGVGTPAQTGTINLTQTGRNVDVVVCDLNGIVWNHPEYAVNADGTGGTRAVQYNWFQHNAEIGNGANGTYSYGTGDHSTHVAGTVAGNTQGWARSANIYNLYYDTGTPVSEFSLVFDYVRAFHRNKAVNNTTGRKNPTIVNNSWGMSIFPSEWSFSDITAVTYRGTRYTPNVGSPTFNGFSGVCTANERLAVLAGFENHGNRITTVGPYTAPGGSILTKPGTWTQEGQQAYFIDLSQPNSSYQLTVQGPADLDLIHNVAIDAISGTMSLAGEIVITNSSAVEIHRFTAVEQTTTNGGTIEININETLVNLPASDTYTVTFLTVINVSGVSNPSFATAMSLTVVTDSHLASASVTTITNTLLGAGSLASSTTPTVGNNDDGYWTLALPFSIEYLGTTYSTIYVSTNHYVTFGSGSTVWSGLNATTPNLPKIMWACADNSVQRIYYGVEGTAPNRTYRVRVEGAASTSGTVGSPSMVNEYVFYEATPDQIDLQLGANGRKTVGTGFTTEQLNSWGFVAGQRIPARVPACDVDLEDLYSEGIIMVGAAGNGRWKHDVPGGLDWSNTFEMASRYPASVAQPYFYMRGTSPTANDTFQSYNIVCRTQSGQNGWFVTETPWGQLPSYVQIGWTIDMGAWGTRTITDIYVYNGYTALALNGSAGFSQGQTYTLTDPTSYNLPAICVGSVDTIATDQKVLYSDCGPGVDLWAPGTYIISSLPSGINDPRNGSYFLGKFSGTSMASPQVCGVLACALEIYPNMDQTQAKAYILAYAKSDQLIATSGGAVDGQDLQGAANLFLYYYKERAVNGNTFPKINYKPRPSTGAVYPRPRIRRTL